MNRSWKFLCVLVIIFGCKKPFTPSGLVSTNDQYLVIEGVINGSGDSTVITLSRTKKIDTLKTIIPETNAVVTVESDAGNTYPLVATTAGNYAVPPINIDATHKYRLRIKTSGGEEYLSDYVVVKNAPPIDSVGFVAQATGVQIYVNAHDDANATRYYRWQFNEDWQFHSKYASAYYSTGDSIAARKVTNQVYNCFGKDQSGDVIIVSTTKLTKDIVFQAPLTKIPSTSEKIETKYSILVKQFALTSDAYGFWENLQKNTEQLGSIFDALPSQAESNFHCLSNPNQLVIGYLSVGNVSYKRIFISAGQLLSSYSPQYPDDCELDTAYVSPDFSQKSSGILIPANSPYIPVLGLYIPPLNPFGYPTAYTYSTIICVDCTVRGTTQAPPFWK